MTRSALLIHGGGAGGWEWNIWHGAMCAKGLAVRAPDLQPSPDGLRATVFDDYTTQARDALGGLARPRAVIGASLGGLIAAAVADEADALVLVNALPPAPFHSALSDRSWPPVVPWHRNARLASTRRAMADADDATALYAFRRWCDESGAVLRAAYAGIGIARPYCPVLCIVSEQDEEVPASTMLSLAAAWETDLVCLPNAGHLTPLLGRDAADIARRTVAWLSAR